MTARPAALCQQCGRLLTADERAVYKKLVNRGAETFLCATCLAAHFRVPEALIHDRIAYFKSVGCTLFPGETGNKE